MSGHSKWDTIHRDKAINDQKRGQQFTKVANAISLAVKESGGITDPGANFKLRLSIEKARSINMPNDKIQKAVDRGTGKVGGADLTGVTYEGYAPGGVGVLVETLSDNRQRTIQEVKNIFDRVGGSIASPGSVSFNFVKTGMIEVEIGNENKDDLTLKLIDLGAEDFVEEDGMLIVYVSTDKIESLKSKVSSLGVKLTSADVIQRPINLIEINNQKEAEQLAAFIDKLNDLDDVQKVYVNASFSGFDD